jgi:hypothetical protein
VFPFVHATKNNAKFQLAFVMEPEQLPESYYNFLKKMAGIPEMLLHLNRIHVRNLEENINDATLQVHVHDVLEAMHEGCEILDTDTLDIISNPSLSHGDMLKSIPCKYPS